MTSIMFEQDTVRMYFHISHLQKRITDYSPRIVVEFENQLNALVVSLKNDLQERKFRSVGTFQVSYIT